MNSSTAGGSEPRGSMTVWLRWLDPARPLHSHDDLLHGQQHLAVDQSCPSPQAFALRCLPDRSTKGFPHSIDVLNRRCAPITPKRKVADGNTGLGHQALVHRLPPLGKSQQHRCCSMSSPESPPEVTTPGRTPTSPPAWRPTDLEAIRIALLIPATQPAVRAINDAMRQLEQGYPDAIPTAQGELAAIAEVDAQLMTLTAEQLQTPIEITRTAAAPDVLTPGAPPPVAKADVIEYATDLLKEEIKTRYAAATAPALVLQQRRVRHSQGLLLMLPSLISWSTDPQLNAGAGSSFLAPLQRG